MKGSAAMAFPRLATLWLAANGVVLILKGGKGVTRTNLFKWPDKKGKVRVGAVIILGSLYVFTINFLGFFVSSFIFLPILMLIIGVKDWKVLIGLPVVLLLLVYLLIEKLLLFPLP